MRGVAVQDLAPETALRYRDAGGAADHRREVRDEQQRRTVARVAQERQRAVRAVVGHGPAEAVGVGVELVQRRVRAQRPVEVADPAPDARMRGDVAEMPVDLPVVVPLAPLRELAAHEEQLLARQRPLVAVEQPQVRELLPVVAGHLRRERALAVDDLVVRQRQHVVLAPRVHGPERQLVVVVLAVDRVEREVLERVVHPAHVPLRAEAQTIRVRRPRHARPRRRLLRVRLHVGERPVDLFVHLLQERHRRGSPARRTGSGSTRPLRVSSRGRASTRRRRPADRRRGTGRARSTRC